ncbi:T6SS phospholipase effector Tle1-like catalytic domain-containing protein [Dyella caseinilytica]|uniref:DUF2235 domain-containing protein n=1 Tax=Dyella caseinilytica TaxID=1849581 RepID=A0ABX7GUQ6_9GAMM|nr:DUF2235 domain-containing protein [Dyella caseinilytica]QRN54191.1 DUF2235 domain-containing protein [Dyella caseinilytica]
MRCIHAKETVECQGQVYVSLFFDGTGNNQNWIEPRTTGDQRARNKHSNVARLFNAAPYRPEDGFFPYYISGVGTPFKEIGDNSATLDSWLGNGAGYMGADRINWGITRIFNAVHHYATDGHLLIQDNDARTLVNTISSSWSPARLSPGAPGYMAAEYEPEKQRRLRGLRPWEDKLAAVLKGRQRTITSINVAVFGFSRGVAQARTFAHWLSELLKEDAGACRTLAGVPLRLSFMGLFDTVASVGNANLIPGFDGHMAWADGSQSIAAVVEQCVHYIALHEQRACFPSEMASNVRQVGYPGMHSDVGGGYLPTEQGKLGQLSQIPLNDMHHEAMKAGVPLLSRKEINDRPTLKEEFDIPMALIEAYNAYWRENGFSANATGKDGVLDTIQQHTRQYLQWRQAAPSRVDLNNRDFCKRATDEDQKKLAAAQDDLVQQVRDLRLRMQPQAAHLVAEMLQGGLPATAWANRGVSASTRELYSAVTGHADVRGAVHRLFDDYVHDSRAGFLVGGAPEPHGVTGGYLRYRNIYQNHREQCAMAVANASTDLIESIV